MEDQRSFEDLSLDTDLDGFYSGKSGTGMVSLEPLPMSLGSGFDDAAKAPSIGEGVVAAASAAASALYAGKVADVMGAALSTAVPTSLQPVKEKAGQFLSKAQPWRDFIIPLSMPAAKDACSRMTANLYLYQTNYAILFVVQLVLNILLQPSCLITLVVVALIWVGFLKKNDDPDWKPVVGGVEMGPMQRWLALAALSATVLLLMAGGTVLNSALMYVVFAIIHGMVHDPSAKGLPGGDFPVPL